MSNKRKILLALAAAGLVGTWYHNLAFMLSGDGGFGLWAFIRGGFVNHAAASLSVDILVAAVTGLFWMSWESRRLGMRHLWLYYLATLGVAFAFAFPLFLFHRERYLGKA